MGDRRLCISGMPYSDNKEAALRGLFPGADVQVRGQLAFVDFDTREAAVKACALGEEGKLAMNGTALRAKLVLPEQKVRPGGSGAVGSGGEDRAAEEDDHPPFLRAHLFRVRFHSIELGASSTVLNHTRDSERDALRLEGDTSSSSRAPPQRCIATITTPRSSPC